MHKLIVAAPTASVLARSAGAMVHIISFVCLLAIGLLFAPTLAAQEFQSGAIRVLTPWSRATPESSKVAGGFMTLVNTGKTSDRLIGGSTAVSRSLEIHEMHIVNGIMMMRQINPGIALKPGARVVLKPFSHHLMMMDLKQPLRPGDKIKGTLVFEKAGVLPIEYDVLPMGSQGPSPTGTERR